MPDEVSQAEVPAPELEATVAPVSEVQTPEVAENQVEQQEEKKYSQAEIDAMIGKRLAREQRKWEREQAQRAQPSAPLASPVAPEQFESTDAYVEALATQKAEQLLEQREQRRQQSELLESYHDKEEKAREKYDDFEQVAYNPKLPITDVMAQSIQASDIGPEVAYHLGANPKEAERISRLSPILQAKEIGKLEAKLAADPPVKKTSNAPTPISPITARSTGSPAYDTTDPRSIKTMSTSDWIEADRQRQIKKLESQRNR
jgi:hypothetical protein